MLRHAPRVQSTQQRKCRETLQANIRKGLSATLVGDVQACATM
jgi:hypothetical protein